MSLIRRNHPVRPIADRRARRARGQSMVEFGLVLPIMLVILLVVADFGRLFAAGITVESAARNAAEVAAAEYDQALLLPSVDHAAIHRGAWSSVCDEASSLPNAAPGGGGECSGLPTLVCVHDGADPGCGSVYNEGSGIPAGCPTVAGGATSGMNGSESRYVEVVVCYRFSTLLSITLPTVGGPLASLGGDFFIERGRVFAVADY